MRGGSSSARSSTSESVASGAGPWLAGRHSRLQFLEPVQHHLKLRTSWCTERGQPRGWNSQDPTVGRHVVVADRRRTSVMNGFGTCSGFPKVNVGRTAMAALTYCPGAGLKNRSRPSGDHRGCAPCAGETRYFVPVSVRREGLRQDLDRDVAAKLGIAGAVDLAHAAGAEESQQFVRAETGTGGERHGRPRLFRLSRASSSRNQPTRRRAS
jgi:hypothetical protein